MNNSIMRATQSEQELAKVGKDISDTNVFFKDLVGLMQNVQFRNFYNEYFTEWSDIQVMIFLN